MVRSKYISLLFSSVLVCNLGAKSTVFFSPDDDPRTPLLALIDNAQESIIVAVYTFTETQLAKALVRAHERGVDVQVVVDEFSCSGQWGKTNVLKKGDVPVHVYNAKLHSKEKYAGIMHDKFAVFDNTTVWTGSYNWTYSANFRNQENAILIENEPDIVERFAAQFERLKERCAACGEQRGIPLHEEEFVGTMFTKMWVWARDAFGKTES